MADLRIAKVEKVHPEANAVDLCMVDTLERIPLVQCMGDLTSNSGTIDLHEPTSFTAGDITPTKDRDMYAVVGFAGRVPVVLGWLAPQVSQLAFKGRPNFRVWRHPSDLYHTVEDDGSFTMAWPNGTFLKVSPNNVLEDLTGLDFDQKWAVKRNKTVAPKIRLMVKDGSGVQKVLFDVDAATGNVAVTTAGNLSLAVTGNITSSAAQWTHTGPVEIDGTLHVTGAVTFDNDLSVAGNVSFTGSSVTHGGVNIGKTHVHGGVQAGSANSAVPH